MISASYGPGRFRLTWEPRNETTGIQHGTFSARQDDDTPIGVVVSHTTETGHVLWVRPADGRTGAPVEGLVAAASWLHGYYTAREHPLD
ncbi:hypothetical protein ABZ442_04985 [Streptomyces triculaminicus]|uniref:hypothetical protein n=1 Tax=Streptomyces triculaminicus TaxID=2816232 RepID=UPI0033CF2B56